jgi:hypothetical protein
LRITVDGNLSADELQAIDGVLEKINALAEEFFTGDFDKAFAQAAALHFDSKQLADVAVHMSQRQLVAVVASSVAAQAAPVATNSPSAAPTTESPAEPIVEPTIPVVAAVASPASQPTVATAAASEESTPVLAPATRDSCKSASATDAIVRYVSKLTSDLSVSRSDERLGFTFHTKLEVLLASIKAQRPDADQPVDAAVNKLQDVVSKTALA